MTAFTTYLLSIAAAAIVCGVLRRMLAGSTPAAKLSQVLMGVFLLFTVLTPFATMRIDAWENWSWELQSSGTDAVAEGKSLAKKEWESIISQRVQTYILDKAAQYDASLTVTVGLSEEAIPVPVSVSISGSISPYGKVQLQKYIANDLGIPKEAQIWK